MPEMQEVFRMATQKVRPDPGFVDRQYQNQRRQARRRKIGALVLAAVLVIAGVVIGINTLANDHVQPANRSRPTPVQPSPSEATQGPIDGCVPACAQGFVNPGPLPTGTYQTEQFFGGQMQVTLKSGWTSPEDSTGAFVVSPDASLKNEIMFWEDVYPVHNGKRLGSLPMTSSDLLRWLSGSTLKLEVTKPKDATIGNLPATVVEVSIAKGAANEDPYCPLDVCRAFLGFPQWTDTFGIAGRQVQRFYLSDVRYGGVTHLFVAVVYPDDPRDMEAFASQAEPVLNSVQVPATPA